MTNRSFLLVTAICAATSIASITGAFAHGGGGGGHDGGGSHVGISPSTTHAGSFNRGTSSGRGWHVAGQPSRGARNHWPRSQAAKVHKLPYRGRGTEQSTAHPEVRHIEPLLFPKTQPMTTPNPYPTPPDGGYLAVGSDAKGDIVTIVFGADQGIVAVLVNGVQQPTNAIPAGTYTFLDAKGDSIEYPNGEIARFTVSPSGAVTPGPFSHGTSPTGAILTPSTSGTASGTAPSGTTTSTPPGGGTMKNPTGASTKPHPGGVVGAIDVVDCAGCGVVTDDGCYWVLRKLWTPEGEVVRRVHYCEVKNPDRP